MTRTVFLHAALLHKPLLDCIFGCDLTGTAASLSGHVVLWAERALPELHRDPEAAQGVAGLVLSDLADDLLHRITYFHACFGQSPDEVQIDVDGRPCRAIAFFGSEGGLVTPFMPDDRGTKEDWHDRFADTLTATASAIMRGYGQVAAETLRSRQEPLLVRGGSQARAVAQGTPQDLRHRPAAQDVHVTSIATPYAKFFAMEEYDLQFRRFDGRLSPPISRAAFVSGDAVTVLPYDPRRDRVLLVEQFRMGPLARGDRQMWQLEAIAGRIDPGETPAEAARREAREEAGLTLDSLLEVAQYYPSPGAVTEYLYSYVALTDLPDGCAGIFGMAEEAEDIRGHLVAFDHLMDLAQAGAVTNAPLLLTALWLQRERPRLRR